MVGAHSAEAVVQQATLRQLQSGVDQDRVDREVAPCSIAGDCGLHVSVLCAAGVKAHQLLDASSRMSFAQNPYTGRRT